MKIAIFGGSFNPFHIGHAMVAETVTKELGYDKVIFIPTCIPPHKELVNGGASAFDRLAMISAFCQSESNMAGHNEDIHYLYDSCEVERGGISYTCDTIAYIVEKYKDVIEGRPGLLMGEEIAAEFHKWKNPDKIVQMADIIIVPRMADYSRSDDSVAGQVNKPSGDYKGDFSVSFSKETFRYPFKMISEPVISVSSTDIRNRIENGKSYKYLVPSAVFEYIEEKKLYR